MPGQRPDPTIQRSYHALTRWLTLGMGSVLVAFGGFTYYSEVRNELHRLDHALTRLATAMAAGIRYRLQDNTWSLSLDRVPILGYQTFPVEHELVYARWYDEAGNLVQFLGSPRPESLTAAPGLVTESLAIAEQTAATTAVRQLTVPVYQESQLLGYLQIATPLQPVQAQLARLGWILAIALPASVGVIGLVSSLFSRLALRPIQQVQQQLERFTSDAAHELRTPLAAILSQAQVGLLAAPDEEQQHRLTTIVETTQSLNRLLNQLLLLARYGGTLAPQDLQPLELGAWVEPLAQRYQAAAATQGLTLTFTRPTTALWVRAQPDLLAQVLANLLDNALKHTPAAGQVYLRLLSQPRWAQIEVTDTGVGLAATELPHIFERFYRVERERSPQTGGFGLGLAIARQLITAQRGTLTVRSSLGQGATFAIALPRA